LKITVIKTYSLRFRGLCHLAHDDWAERLESINYLNCPFGLYHAIITLDFAPDTKSVSFATSYEVVLIHLDIVVVVDLCAIKQNGD